MISMILTSLLMFQEPQIVNLDDDIWHIPTTEPHYSNDNSLCVLFLSDCPL